MENIGVANPTTCNYYYEHDFIELFQKTTTNLYQIVAPLYEKGNSILTISRLTGFAIGSIHKCLKNGNLTLRSSTKGNLKDKLRQHFKKFGPPPYGFCYIDGRLEKDAREYQILQIIHQQWLLKKSLTDIANYLNNKKLKTRSQNIWRCPIILKVIQRFEKQSLDLTKGSL